MRPANSGFSSLRLLSSLQREKRLFRVCDLVLRSVFLIFHPRDVRAQMAELLFFSLGASRLG